MAFLLVFRSGSGEATLRYANQSLLDLAETCLEAGAPLPATHELLAAMGLPADLLAQCELAPQQVTIATPRDGLRHFLVEKKLALEISDQGGHWWFECHVVYRHHPPGARAASVSGGRSRELSISPS